MSECAQLRLSWPTLIKPFSSAIAFLYLPYIYVREGVETAITKEFSEVALQEVKQACSNIAKTTEVFVDAANSNDIPLSL